MSLVIIQLKTISNSSSQPKPVQLHPTDNLKKIRKQLENDNIINNTFSFSKKYSIINDDGGESDGFAEIAIENENEFLLNEIIDESCNTLYIMEKLNLEEILTENNHCLVINNCYKIETSKKHAFNFVKKPKMELIDKSYLEIIRPETRIE